MNVEIALTADGAADFSIADKTAVVIDVLRATSVITTAISRGARAVVPFKTVEEALSYAEKDRTSRVLGGERRADRIPGFDCGNSPLEYTREVVGGKEVVLTTTNGTAAIHSVRSAERLYIMCFLNVAAVAEKLIADGKNVLLVCAGTNGKFSADDSLCAGMCVAELERRGAVALDDAGRFLRDFYLAYGHDLKKALSRAAHYNILQSKGFDKDLAYCLQKNVIGITPMYRNGKIS